jgi:hypothetical protein
MTSQPPAYSGPHQDGGTLARCPRPPASASLVARVAGADLQRRHPHPQQARSPSPRLWKAETPRTADLHGPSYAGAPTVPGTSYTRAIGAFSRIVERINRWLQPAAVGAGVETSGGAPGATGTTGATAGATAVTGEIKQDEAEPEDEP